VQANTYEMDMANHNDETKWLLACYPPTWWTSLINPSIPSIPMVTFIVSNKKGVKKFTKFTESKKRGDKLFPWC
jgi:hypothetical protein